MIKQQVYRILLHTVAPRINTIFGEGLSQKSESILLKLLRRHRCRGGILRVFEPGGYQISYHFGEAGKNRLMTEDMVFRVASISKMITAMGVLKLSEEGRIDLDEDVNILPYPASLRQLLSHTAALRDGKAYVNALSSGARLSDVLKDDSYCRHRPGEKWQYSNLGAGLIASVLENKLHMSFESIMQENIFRPLSVQASFYPQRVSGELSDARRILPPAKNPGFDARKRRNNPLCDADMVNPEQHYLLAQGNCCISGKDMQIMLNALLTPGFLNQETLEAMRYPQAVFGEISAKLKQGMGLFLLNDKDIAPSPLYGHQGNAYGAVHAAFFDLKTKRGMAFLSSGVSQAKGDFLADVVTDLLKFCFGGAYA